MFHDSEQETSDGASGLMACLIAVVAFIVCTIGSCSELQYMSSGRTVPARVENMHTVRHHNRRGPDYTMLSVTYTFLDNGLTRHEIEEVDEDWFIDHPANISADQKTVQIEYLPGNEGRARLLGNSYRWLLIPEAISIVFILGAAAAFWRSYAAYQRRLAQER